MPLGLLRYLSSGPACTRRLVSGRTEAVIRNKHAQDPNQPTVSQPVNCRRRPGTAAFPKPLPWSSRRADIGLVLISRHAWNPFCEGLGTQFAAPHAERIFKLGGRYGRRLGDGDMGQKTSYPQIEISPGISHLILKMNTYAKQKKIFKCFFFVYFPVKVARAMPPPL